MSTDGIKYRVGQAAYHTTKHAHIGTGMPDQDASPSEPPDPLPEVLAGS
jgi:hypothetical protein